MVDVEAVILEELERLSPRETSNAADWGDVLRRAQVAAPRHQGAVTSERDRRPHVRIRGRAVRRRTLVLVAAAIVLAAIGAGIAAAVLAKSPEEQSQGLLDGHSVFIGSDPVCTKVADLHFRCVLGGPPGRFGTYVEGSYRGAKFQTVDADKRVDGACIGVTDNGRVWNCYLGELAVERGVIDREMLGQLQPEPGHG